MSIARDEMLRRMEMAASAMDFNARGAPKTRAQLEQMNAGHNAMLGFWQQQYSDQGNYGRTRQLQSDRLRSAEHQVGMEQNGMTRRLHRDDGFMGYGGFRQPTAFEQNYTSGMPRRPRRDGYSQQPTFGQNYASDGWRLSYNNPDYELDES